MSSHNPHGKPLPENGIIAYVRSGTFEKHLSTINRNILKNATNYGTKPDEFGLTWNQDEQLQQIYFRTTMAKLISTHYRQKASEVLLYHFWIYIEAMNDEPL